MYRALAVVIFSACVLPSAGHAPAPPRHAVVGDSITHQRPSCQMVANFGVPSDTSRGVLKRLTEVLELKPHTVDLLIGVNDISLSIPKDETVANVQLMVNRLIEHGVRVRLLNVLPVADYYSHPRLTSEQMNLRISMLNGALDFVAGVERVSFHPPKNGYQRDGIHLNERAYRAMRLRLGQPC